jgi:hypothetical protein
VRQEFAATDAAACVEQVLNRSVAVDAPGQQTHRVALVGQIDMRAQVEVPSALRADTPTPVIERAGGRWVYRQSRYRPPARCRRQRMTVLLDPTAFLRQAGPVSSTPRPQRLPDHGRRTPGIYALGNEPGTETLPSREHCPDLFRRQRGPPSRDGQSAPPSRAERAQLWDGVVIVGASRSPHTSIPRRGPLTRCLRQPADRDDQCAPTNMTPERGSRQPRRTPSGDPGGQKARDHRTATKVRSTARRAPHPGDAHEIRDSRLPGTSSVHEPRRQARQRAQQPQIAHRAQYPARRLPMEHLSEDDVESSVN